MYNYEIEVAIANNASIADLLALAGVTEEEFYMDAVERGLVSPDEPEEEVPKFWERTPEEQDIIRKAYQFEAEAIRHIKETGKVSPEDDERNPYWKEIERMGLVEAINEAIEMEFGNSWEGLGIDD